MAKRKAPVKLTGGGGFRFEDRVAAYFLGQLLLGESPLEPEAGIIREVHFQVAESGWRLDDLLLVLESQGQRRRCALSVKSNVQVTQRGFPSEFVEAVWRQWLAPEPRVLDRERDLLGLVSGRLAEGVKAAWENLLNQALQTEPQRMTERLKRQGQVSAVQRRLFGSLRCPAELRVSGPCDATETVKLLRRVRVLHLDLESPSSGAERDAIKVCRSTLRGGSTDQAVDLWGRLQALAADKRPAGGSYDLGTLVRNLRGSFNLRDHPDYEADWMRLDAIRREEIAGVRDQVGRGIRFPREDLMAELREASASHRVLALVGESGTGKSALAGRFVTSLPEEQRVLWLSASDLNHGRAGLVAQRLGLRHCLSELVTCSSARLGTLVLDGIDRFPGQALDRATEQLKTLLGEPGQVWNAVITCQPQGWQHVLERLLAAGAAREQVHIVEVTSPTLDEIWPDLCRVHGLGRLLLNRELKPFLCNLKHLDWVVVAHQAEPRAEEQHWVCESDVIDWIWARWVGQSTDKYAREGLLLFLGEKEALSLGGGVPVSELNDQERRTAGELEREGLIRGKEGRIHFAHDLIGDWSRLRLLLGSGSIAVARIKASAGIPAWQRAIRLYGQRLLEREGGTGRWRQVLRELQQGPGDEVLAADSFLDALTLAGNAEALLAQAWPDLMADKADLLRRLLKRHLQIATIPDPRFKDVVEPEDADRAAAWFRIPYPPYWHPLLRVLNEHRLEVSKAAVLLTAEVCGLWLRTIPGAFGGREDAGQLALTMAREAQGLKAEGVIFEERCDQRVWEALLYAAPDNPDEVCSIALELSRRRDESAEVVARRRAHQEEECRRHQERLQQDPEYLKRVESLPPPLGVDWNEGPMREPAPDGPRRRVEESFRRAVLDTPALGGLMAVRPAIAREVLSAVCIEEPQPIRYGSDLTLMYFGTAHWLGGQPPMFFRGPFYQFLKANPEEGLEAILRLVNYATARWQEACLDRAPADLDPDVYSLELKSDSGTVRWLGNQRVYCWYRDILIGSSSVVSALMALEKWLYDEIEQGRKIDRWVETIWEKSQSVAFLGVLTAVALRVPGLLQDVLRPLLGAWRLYRWQMELVMQEGSWQISMLNWTRYGQRMVRVVQEWHSLPHRRMLLRDVAIRAFLQSTQVREYFADCRVQWAKDLDRVRERESLEIAIATFDPANWRAAELGDGRVLAQFEWPEHLRDRVAASNRETERARLALCFAPRCRMILQGEESLSAEELSGFWDQLRCLAEMEPGDPDRVKRTRDGVAGGIAVLLTRHREWLVEDARRLSWCAEHLKEVSQSRVPEPYAPGDVYDAGAEGFLGEAAVALACESPEGWVRALVADSVLGYYYSSTALTVAAAFRFRRKTGDDFGRVLNLVVLWAGLRCLMEHCATLQVEAGSLPSYRARLADAYAAKTLSATLIPLAKAERVFRKLLERIDRKHGRGWWLSQRTRAARQEHDREVSRVGPGLDTRVIQQGFTFLPRLSDSANDEERRQIIQYYRELLNLFLQSMPKASGKEEVAGAPYEFDRWVFHLVADLVPQLEATENPRSFWEPILDLGPAAHYWVEDFLGRWFTTGLGSARSVGHFAMHWQQMVVYSLESPVSDPEVSRWFSYRLERMSVELMGLGLASTTVGGSEFKETVKEDMAPLYERWAERWLKRPGAAVRFAEFLGTEAGGVLLPMAVKRLGEAVERYSEHDWRSEKLDAPFADALRACWKSHRAELEADPGLKRAFLGLLNKLCARLVPEAIELRTQVGQSLP